LNIGGKSTNNPQNIIIALNEYFLSLVEKKCVNYDDDDNGNDSSSSSSRDNDDNTILQYIICVMLFTTPFQIHN
jgi:hypothetical protein